MKVACFFPNNFFHMVALSVMPFMYGHHLIGSNQRIYIVAFTSLLFMLLINIVIHIYCIIIVHGSGLSSNIM
jgi:hypothetical protein